VVSGPARPTWAWLPTLLLIVVAVLTVTPVLTALVAGFRSAPPGRPGAITVESIQASFAVMAEPDVWRILWTTVWLSTVRAVLALALAVVLAWIIARTDCPFRNRLEFLLILSFFFPLLGKVLGWALLLSPQKGYLNQLLRHLPMFAGDSGPLDIFSYGGLIFVSVTGWATLLTIFLVPAFRNMDAALEESARMCGASPRRTIMRILVPLLRPAILAAFILSLTRLLSSFETEVFLGTSSGIYVLTNKIYERMVQIFPPDFRTGMTMAVMLLVITFTLVLVNWKFLGKRDYTTVSGRGYSARPMALGRLRWVAFGFVMLFFVVTVVLPAVMLVQVSFIRFIGLDVFDPASYTTDNWRRMLTLRVNRLALTNSLVMSIVATTVGMIIYSLVSYVVTRSRYPGRRLLDLAAWVPWAVPSLVLGLGVLWAVLLSPLAMLYGTLTVLILAPHRARLSVRDPDHGLEHDPDQPRARGGRAHPQGLVAVDLPAHLAAARQERLRGGLGHPVHRVVQRSGDRGVPVRPQIDGAADLVPEPVVERPAGGGRGRGADDDGHRASRSSFCSGGWCSAACGRRPWRDGPAVEWRKRFARRKRACFPEKTTSCSAASDRARPVGALLRQYWIPALMSSELPSADGAPVAGRFLGENLIAFRATSGKIGLIQNHCPHRGASLFFGRNEEEGLRCVYHGWKFDCEGACVDMPNEPAESNFKSKVRRGAYPCVERNDIVWTYMGPRRTPPPLPDIEPNMLPRGEFAVQKVLRECNWFQALEGDIDTSHLGFLHLGAVTPAQTTPGTFDYYNVTDRAPKYEVVDTEFGTSYGAYRPAEADTYYWRIAHYLFPFFTMIPTGILGMQVLVRAWCPSTTTT
jgi:ABC-type Fe3+ transport system permease subunit/nitrite reductase/ring-hydroxylating ferredoxin subunit